MASGSEAGKALSEAIDAFVERTQYARQLLALRADKRTQDSYARDLRSMKDQVGALETSMKGIQQALQKELNAVPKMERLIKACAQHRAHLGHVAGSMPRYALGHARGQPSEARDEAEEVGGGDENQNIQQQSAQTEGAREATGKGRNGGAAGGRSVSSGNLGAAPRVYIKQQELDAAESYMRGRLTLDKVNEIIDEIAEHAEGKARLMAAARSGSAKLTGPQRKQAFELLHSVANCDGVRGSMWFLESDLRNGRLLKMEKSGQSTLMLLRHLNRVKEVRVAVNNQPTKVFVLIPH